MREFDPFYSSHPVLRPGEVYNLRLTGPEIRAFHAFDFVSRLSVSRSRGRNSGKSPTLSAEILVLQRFSAETGSITTAAPNMALCFPSPEWTIGYPSPALPRERGSYFCSHCGLRNSYRDGCHDRRCQGRLLNCHDSRRQSVERVIHVVNTVLMPKL